MRKTSIVKKCEICNKEFKVHQYSLKNGHGRFCSLKCKGEATKVFSICQQCGKKFNRKGKYCSRSCNSLSQLGKKISEETRKKLSLANKGYIASEETRKKLSIANSKPRPWQKSRITDKVREKLSIANKGKKRSLECRLHQAEIRKGAKSHLWKGGISPVNEAIRKTLEYRLWRTAVFERDNYQCIWGGKEHNNRLVADHIKPFALYPELRFAIDNGRTLCEECHKKTNTYGGKTNHF